MPNDINTESLAQAIIEHIESKLTTPSQRFFGVADAAKYAGLSEDSVRSLISAGKLTGLRPVGGRVLIDKQELDSLILTSTKRPPRGRGVRK